MRAIIILLLAFVLVAGATTVTFQPNTGVGKDSYTTDEHPESNFGQIQFCKCGKSTGNSLVTFVEFTELNDSQYQGATVISAELSLYVLSYGGSGSYMLGACSDSWIESTITWNNMPGTHESFSADYPTDRGWITLDVTAYVQNWLDGTWDNNGFVLFDDDGESQFITTLSSEYAGDPTVRPKLVMEYTPAAAVEESTWGQLKATF